MERVSQHQTHFSMSHKESLLSPSPQLEGTSIYLARDGSPGYERRSVAMLQPVWPPLQALAPGNILGNPATSYPVPSKRPLLAVMSPGRLHTNIPACGRVLRISATLLWNVRQWLRNRLQKILRTIMTLIAHRNNSNIRSTKRTDRDRSCGLLIFYGQLFCNL